MIDDFAFDAGDRFTYEYNFFEHWLHDVRVEAVHEDSTLRTPFCLDGHGMPGATPTNERDKTLALLDTIVRADESTMVGDIRKYINALDTVRFNRQRANVQLSKLNLASPALEHKVIWLNSR